MAKINKIFSNILRLLAVAATVVAIVFMVTSHDSAQVLNLTFTAKYSYTPAFKFFVVGEAIAGGYTVISILLSFKTLFWRIIVFLDMVATVLLASSISAALAIAQVGKKGSAHAGWLPVCGQVPHFCDRVTVALLAGFAAAVIYFVILLCSLYAVL
ncbi:CASP protein [Salix suchowensis]|uniref:CASP-like protein n=1 Tax=Salix koriyanagi TaxID=2511006 RepID=A0A9Q0ZBP8_9ROSI|nr:CASP protein [Salix suchowensis]KAJ6728591.1 CASP-LIKE PROTEIN 1C1 [Salix koriyanagi]